MLEKYILWVIFSVTYKEKKKCCTYMVAVVSLFQIAETIENVFSSWHKCFLALYATFLYLVEYCSSKNGHQLICCICFCFFESFLNLWSLIGIQKCHSKFNWNGLWNDHYAVFISSCFLVMNQYLLILNSSLLSYILIFCFIRLHWYQHKKGWDTVFRECMIRVQ